MNQYSLKIFKEKLREVIEIDIEAKSINQKDLAHILECFEGDYMQANLYKYETDGHAQSFPYGRVGWDLKVIFKPTWMQKKYFTTEW